MSVAIAEGHVAAQIGAVVAMGVLIIAVDRLFWWPLVIWSRKFKLEDTASGPREFTRIGRLVAATHLQNLTALIPHRLPRPPAASEFRLLSHAPPRWLTALGPILFWVLLALGTWGAIQLGLMLVKVPLHGWGEILWAAGATFLRVVAALAMSSLWTVPVGVWIGLNPKLGRVLQPVIQFAASFPAPMLYPVVFGLILATGGNLQWGSMVLMMLGAQWYILFNVAAGAQAIPADLISCADIFRFRGWARWKTFLLPAIFPPLVIGWITAAGGAWNASIVSEYLQQGGRTYTATGLGASISEATNAGDFNKLAASVVVMAVCVVAVNRTFWKRLQTKADLYCRFGG
jgi:NitT/TauT family transport system permease protein